MPRIEKLIKKLRHPSVWTSITYFGEGFPYSLVHALSSLFFTYSNVKLELLGLTSLYHLPWNLKFLWSSAFDQFGTKKKWIVLIEIGLLIGTLLLAVFAGFPIGLKVAAVLFLILAFLAASHDIAIDGYYLEALDKEGQAKWVGMRAMAYRVAMLVASSGIVFLANVSWTLAFLACAGILALLLIYNFFLLPEPQIERKKLLDVVKIMVRMKSALLVCVAAIIILIGKVIFDLEIVQRVFGPMDMARKISVLMAIAIVLVIAALPLLKKRLYRSDSFFAKSFISLLDQPKIGGIIFFIIFYRFGEILLINMKTPFFKGVGVSLADLSIANGIFGTIATIVGTIFGGILISKFTLKKTIWPLALSQNFANFLYMYVAWYYQDIYFVGDLALRPADLAVANFWFVSFIISAEAFAAGMGTAAFMVYIMRCVKKSYKASHTAFWTAIMSIAVLITGPVSGIMAAEFGFATFFGLTFIATIPGMLVIFYIPYVDGKTAQDLEE